jgi:protein phosphatase
MTFRIEWAALSDVGRRRDHNEDSFLADEEEGLWVVADGMGGHQGGEDASLLAVESIHHYMVELHADPALAARFVQPLELPQRAIDLAAAIRYANERIFVEALKDPAKEGMGTTVVAVARDGDRVILAHVGDSRIYRVRQQQLEQVTVDHSLINHLLATNQITPEQVEGFGKSNVILRALGLKDAVEVDVRMEPLVDGDIYLLCSDGLTDMVNDPVISQVMAKVGPYGDDLHSAVQQLVHLANTNGGVDNITVCLVQACTDEQPTVVL